jgi:hypothetical protein
MVWKLRSAVAIFFGLLTVALLVFWVRSHWHSEIIHFNCVRLSRQFLIGTIPGRLVMIKSPWEEPQQPMIYVERLPLNPWSGLTTYGFLFDPSDYARLILPFWFAIAVTGTIAAGYFVSVPIPRFSCRAMFIAVTAMGFTFGIWAWFVR